MPSSLELLAASIKPPVTLTLEPVSGASLNARIMFNVNDVAPEDDAPKRRPLKLSARSSILPKATQQLDMGEGQQQWAGLSVSVDRKKRRCAECTRPLAQGADASVLLCDRCTATSSAASTNLPLPSPALQSSANSRDAHRPQCAPAALRAPLVLVELKRPAAPKGDWLRIHVLKQDDEGREKREATVEPPTPSTTAQAKEDSAPSGTPPGPAAAEESLEARLAARARAIGTGHRLQRNLPAVL